MSTHFPIKFLSPSRQKRRRNSLMKERQSLQHQVPSDVAYISNINFILQVSIYTVNVDDATNEELFTLTSQICHKSKGELEKLLAEAEKSGKDKILKETDVEGI